MHARVHCVCESVASVRVLVLGRARADREDGCPHAYPPTNCSAWATVVQHLLLDAGQARRQDACRGAGHAQGEPTGIWHLPARPSIPVDAIAAASWQCIHLPLCFLAAPSCGVLHLESKSCCWTVFLHAHARGARVLPGALLQGTLADFKNELLFRDYGMNYNDLPEQFRKVCACAHVLTEAARVC